MVNRWNNQNFCFFRALPAAILKELITLDIYISSVQGISIAGSITRSVTTARAVADPETTRSAVKIEKLLKPLRYIAEGL
jgi:response regulator of citrate/malate metabolism